MSTKRVILYFDDESDAVRFTVAASSLISGDSQASRDTRKLIQPLTRANRIRVGRSAARAEESAVLVPSGG